MEECRQVNVPKVDNTTKICEVLVKEKCIVASKKRLTPIEILIGDNYEAVMDKLLAKVRELENRIDILEL